MGGRERGCGAVRLRWCERCAIIPYGVLVLRVRLCTRARVEEKEKRKKNRSKRLSEASNGDFEASVHFGPYVSLSLLALGLTLLR